jgi:hypothetical protein
VAEPAQPSPDAVELVGLFLIFDDDDRGVAVVGDVGDLVGEGLGKEHRAGPAEGLGGEVGDEDFGAVPAEHGDRLTRFETELQQAQRERLDAIPVGPPRERPPDATVLGPHGHPVRALGGGAQHQLGHGHFGVRRCVHDPGPPAVGRSAMARSPM